MSREMVGEDGRDSLVSKYGGVVTELGEFRIRACSGDLRPGGEGVERIMNSQALVRLIGWQDQMRGLVSEVIVGAREVGIDGWKMTEETSRGLTSAVSNFVYNQWEPLSINNGFGDLIEWVGGARDWWLENQPVDMVDGAGFLIKHWTRAEVREGRSEASRRLAELVTRQGMEMVLAMTFELKSGREQLAVWKALGVLSPDVCWERFAIKLGWSESGLYRRLRAAVEKINDRGVMEEGLVVGRQEKVVGVISDVLSGVLRKRVTQPGLVIRDWQQAEVREGRSEASRRLAELVTRQGMEMVLAMTFELKSGREQLAVWRALGILEPDVLLWKFGLKVGITTKNYEMSLRSAVRQLEERPVNGGLKELQMSTVVRVIRQTVDNLVAIRSGIRPLSGDSRRVRVMRMFNNLDQEGRVRFWEQLTSRETEVIKVVMSTDDGMNFMTIAKIADAFDVDQVAVRAVIGAAERVLTGQRKWFVDKHGEPMRSVFPAPLLALLPRIEQTGWGRVVGRLNPLQQEVMNYLRHPDADGHYPDLDDIANKFGDGSKNWRLYLRNIRVLLVKYLEEEG